MTDKNPLLTIRPATEFDLDEIAGIHCAAALTAFANIFPPTAPKPTPTSLRPRWQRLIDDPAATVLVAETNGVDGCVALRPESAVPSGTLLDGLYVHPRNWGAGIGIALHDAIVDVATEQVATAINLWVLEDNSRARAMYERRGWKLVPGRKLANEPETVIDVLYQLTIT
ncbi:MAG: GNAT family N-acetyltransferase [Actinomycetota bacterium]|nr:GNAT family N-acetyltransferase [Actinomycetota bacterium]